MHLVLNGEKREDSGAVMVEGGGEETQRHGRSRSGGWWEKRFVKLWSI